MGKELVIASNRHETKLAILEDEQLVELFFQRSNEYSLAGSIHKGRVTRVLPGMQSAFVDIGLERDAFLYVSDFLEQEDELDTVPAEQRPEPPEVSIAAQGPAAQTFEKAHAGSPSDRTEEPERRDRRTRRSRRRKTRGHGFPESKYASEVETVQSRNESQERQEPEEEQFSILPGESLAKYKKIGGESAESGTENETVGASAPPAEGELNQPGAMPSSEDIEAEVESASEELSPSEDSGNGGEESAADFESPEDDTETPEDEENGEEEDEHEPAVIPELAEELSSEAGPPDQVDEEAAAGNELSGSEDSEVEAEGLTPEAAEIEEELSNTRETNAAGPETETEEAAATGEEEAGPPVSLTATIREQGTRYLHRTSRRLRRKMRLAAAGNREEADRHSEQKENGAEPTREAETPRLLSRPEKAPPQSISELLHEGQEILVQIAKEPLGQKGARITSHIALPGRYVVYMPTVEHQGVSRKIASDEERARLKRILMKHRTGITGGFIIRTAGEGRTEQEIASDMQFLVSLWMEIRHKADTKPAPALIHHDLDLVSRTLRDQLTENFKAVWTDNEQIYESVLRFVQRFQPSMVHRVKLYTRSMPIFDAFNITNELEKALRPKVWLKSGGYIVINQTEALVAVDVNTGKFVGKSNRLEDTIYKTNAEAVKEIARQIRLRDLGGIIVIDFIDMDERKNRQKVMQALEEAMHSDRAPTKILQFNDFGLVAITRKRVKQSLERALCSPCPYCEGAGYVKSVETVIGEIIQEAAKISRAVEGREVMLRVNPEVAKQLKSPKNSFLEEIEEILGRPVLVRSDPTLQQETFDLA